MYKNPQIVILDEATSALDEVSERIVQKALDELTEGRTSIIISHRLNSIAHADDILVLKNGELERTGDFKWLMHDSVTFRELFAAQAKRLEMTETFEI